MSGIFSVMLPENKSRLIGDITILMAASKLHRHFPVLDLMDIVLAPVNLNQFRIYHNQDKKPIAFVSWGFFTQEVLDRYLAGDVELSQAEWSQGDLLVFTDFIAPYGHSKEILTDLRTKIFPDSRAISLRFDEVGRVRKKVRCWHGIRARKLN